MSALPPKADIRSARAVTSKLDSKMDLVGSGVDQLHVIPASTRPAFGFTQTLPDSAVKVLGPLHDGYAPTMETNMRIVKPAFAHRISIFRIECHHEAIHDFTSLSHGSVDRVGSHTNYRPVDSRKIRSPIQSPRRTPKDRRCPHVHVGSEADMAYPRKRILQREARMSALFAVAVHESHNWSSDGTASRIRQGDRQGPWVHSPAMDDTTTTAQVIIRPPLAWGIAVIAGLALNWLLPLAFLPAGLPVGWLGAMVFVLALALFVWAIVTITSAGSNVPTNRPTTTVVESGPYYFTRNPIYLGMFLGLIGLAIAFDNLWLLLMLAPFALVIRYGVVARGEAYLELKFGDVYRRYRSRVRRWL